MTTTVLKSVKSRELRGGILFTDCYCLRRNGLQNDCRRGGCQGLANCTDLPYAKCEPAKAACVRHCANPYASHLCAVCPPQFRSTSKAENKAMKKSKESITSLASDRSGYKKEQRCKWKAPCEAQCYNQYPETQLNQNGYCVYFPYAKMTAFKHGFHKHFICPKCLKRFCRVLPHCRCSPCGPMVCYKYEDCGPPDSEHAERSKSRGNDVEKIKEKENPLKKVKSRELRAGIMYYSCDCIKRNGLQHDCRRTGCGGEPTCVVLPDPLCGPSQLSRMRGLANPAVLAGHMNAKGGSGGHPVTSAGRGKRKIIVCELKGMMSDSDPTTQDGVMKCCCDLDEDKKAGK